MRCPKESLPLIQEALEKPSFPVGKDWIPENLDPVLGLSPEKEMKRGMALLVVCCIVALAILFVSTAVVIGVLG